MHYFTIYGIRTGPCAAWLKSISSRRLFSASDMLADQHSSHSVPDAPSTTRVLFIADPQRTVVKQWAFLVLSATFLSPENIPSPPSQNTAHSWFSSQGSDFLCGTPSIRGPLSPSHQASSRRPLPMSQPLTDPTRKATR